ncbi:hypothetical protein DB346_07125 [Verrucomicrobia bacterium LW23]|nr:hypothetical protein DB346_07125 [Verrucomicrobia bacterium LW23]
MLRAVAWCVAFNALFMAAAVAQDRPTDVLRLELEEAKARVTTLSASTGLISEEHRKTLAEARERLTLLQERNNMLLTREDRGGFVVYATNSQVAQEYVRMAEHYVSVYRQLFTDFKFTQRNPVHFIVYPTKEQYLKYEQIPQWAGGHALTRRIVMMRIGYSDKGYTIEADPRYKMLRLALYYHPDYSARSATLGHEVAHILVWEMLNKNDKEFNVVNGNRFLNEGVADYVGTYNMAQAQNERLSILNKTPQPIGPFTWLDTPHYPATPNQISEYYAEAHLFVRWLATADTKGGARLKVLLPSRDFNDFKKRLEEFERNEPLYKINLDNYAPYRKKVLSTVPR